MGELEEVGAKVYAASADPLEKAQEVASEVSYPIAYGVRRAQADWIGAWWEERRGIVQPAEFVIGEQGRIVTSSYSSGPIGRIDAKDVVGLITYLESQKKAKE